MRAASGRVLDTGLTLQHFVLQSQFISAYRSAIRSTRPLPDSHTRRETLNFLRGDIERLRGLRDLESLKSQLSQFHRTVKIMVPSLGLGGLTPEQGAVLIGRRGRRPWSP